jgi:response regulator RpfG family c-di-GMP phosphodiesterase
MFGQVMSRHSDSRRSPLWLEQARGQASGVRLEEEHASQLRYEALEATDRRRLEAVERAERVQQRKDHLALRLGLATAGLLGLVFVGLALLFWLR